MVEWRAVWDDGVLLVRVDGWIVWGRVQEEHVSE